MQRLTAIALLMLLIGVASAAAGEEVQSDDLKALVRQGLEDLGRQKGNPNLCVLTNALYVRLAGIPGVHCLDIITDLTGCAMGRGNLLFYHAPITGPLRITLFRKDTGNAIVISRCDGSAGEPLTSPYSPVVATATAKRLEYVKTNIASDKIVNLDSYAPVMKEVGSPAEAFSVASILSGWALGAPLEFLKCCEFHDYYCPGVIIGYFIAKVTMDKYPLGKGQKYVWIGSPAKCGDNAIQVLLDLTPGKPSCCIKELTPSHKKAITVEAPLNNVMGILVV